MILHVDKEKSTEASAKHRETTNDLRIVVPVRWRAKEFVDPRFVLEICSIFGHFHPSQLAIQRKVFIILSQAVCHQR